MGESAFAHGGEGGGEVDGDERGAAPTKAPTPMETRLRGKATETRDICVRGPEERLLAFIRFFSPSTIYIIFPYSFRILVPNRVYILEYAKNTAPNRAYILKYSLCSR